jgi:hypothetical protein
MLKANSRMQTAQALAGVLDSLRSGEIAHPNALRTTLIARVMRPFRMDPNAAKFDLLYAALQLFILNRGGENESQFEELFQLAVSHVYSLVSMESSGTSGLSYQVEHFLAHAAVFLSLNDSSEPWSEVVGRAGILMEQWGIAPIALSI